MRLPFGVHATVRADFERRWAVVRPLLLLSFLGPPLVSLLVGLATQGSGVDVLGWVLLVVGVAVPVWFLMRRVYLHQTGWWTGLVAYSAAVQAVGIWLLALNPLLMVPTVAAAAGAVSLLGKANAVLLDVVGGAIAGTTLGVRSASRQVRSAKGRLVLARASFDGDLLRWHVSTGPSNPETFGGDLPLREVTDVWVAETRGAPGGEVVVVRTADRDVELVVGHPHDFATLLDRRVRLLGEEGWS